MGYNSANSVTYPTGDQIGYAFFGEGMTSTQVSKIDTRLHAYMTAVGAPSGC